MSKIKVVIVVGTRPNFIKITQFEKEFNKYVDIFDYKLVHTGQHYDENMSKVFFGQLGLKKPDITLDIKGRSACHQVGTIIIELETLFKTWNPHLVVVVGDVNSTLAAAITANKSKIKIAHLESGLRSFDREMPEEINRILTDSITDIFFVTEESGIENLNKEIKHESHVHFVGNTMIDTLVAFDDIIQKSKVLNDLGLEKNKYALMTMHRPRNVDTKQKLEYIIEIIKQITSTDKLVFPIHPRTKNSFIKHGLFDKLMQIKYLVIAPPLGYIEFQKLIADAILVITDSGGIQEETTFRQVPCLTLRDNTERPITTKIGSNVLLPFDLKMISQNINEIKTGSFKKGEIPPLWDGNATQRIVDIIIDHFKKEL